MDNHFLVILISIVFSGFFSGMEIAFVSTNKIFLEIEKKQKGLVSFFIKKITINPSKFITTMLLGNNIALVIYGIYSGRLIINVFFPELINKTSIDFLVPLDLNIETKQKLELVVKIAHYFNSEVHLITNDSTDSFIKTKLKANQIWATKYLDSNKIKNSSHLVPKGKTLSEGIFLLSYNVKADLIAIMNLQDDSILGLLENSFQDEIIGNDYKIPVLCVNPHVITKASGSVFVR